MDSKLLKQEAVQVTLKLVDEPPDKWRTFNDKLNSSLIKENYQMRSPVKLQPDEEPIYECVLEDSFVLITTKRLITDLNGKTDEIYIGEIKGLGNEFEKENYKPRGEPQPKINLVSVIGENERRIVFKIDSYYPAFFSKMLIQNLSCYLRNGKWYMNPGGERWIAK